jgi:magnesium chelatase family protein
MARTMQQDRFRGLGRPDIRTNSQCTTALVEQVAKPDPADRPCSADAAEKMRFSARAYHRILKVARTLADLDGAETVGRIHLAESISYRIAAERITGGVKAA